jgi:hypothetical protein
MAKLATVSPSFYNTTFAATPRQLAWQVKQFAS